MLRYDAITCENKVGFAYCMHVVDLYLLWLIFCRNTCNLQSLSSLIFPEKKIFKANKDSFSTLELNQKLLFYYHEYAIFQFPVKGLTKGSSKISSLHYFLMHFNGNS